MLSEGELIMCSEIVLAVATIHLQIFTTGWTKNIELRQFNGERYGTIRRIFQVAKAMPLMFVPTATLLDKMCTKKRKMDTPHTSE